ncbi:MAG: motility associated factor glycosyltransferase family protein [Lachnospiraceae bacterium]|nr:motility associated factor glycosyltransferase family protein [Lachnospiraceae bacterium]
MEYGELFEKNMDLLNANYHEFREKAEDLWNQHSDMIEKIHDFETYDGQYGIYIQEKDGIIQLNSQYEAVDYANEWAENVIEKEHLQRGYVVIVFGLGNGSYVKALLEKLPEETYTLIYEPSPWVFLNAIQHIDLQELMELAEYRADIFVEGINMMWLRELWMTKVSIHTAQMIQMVSIPVYQRIFHKQCQTFTERICELNKLIEVNWNTLVRFARSQTENQIALLPYLLKSYSLFQLQEKLPQNYPAIIVAAGPSLKKNMQEIKRAKNKAFIIAVDTAMKTLMAEGIIPDIYVTVDPEKPIELFEDPRIHKIPVCLVPFSVKEAFEKQENKIFVAMENGYIHQLCLRYGKRFKQLKAGGTVAQVAFSLATNSGMSPVILVGQDLAYTDDETHAAGIYKNQKKAHEMDESKLVWVEDIHGQKIRTEKPLLQYKKWYEDRIKFHLEGIRVIDATEGGAKIEGTEIMRLQEAIDEFCNREYDFTKLITEIEHLFTQEEQQQLMAEFMAMPQVLQEIQQKSCEGKELYKELIEASEKETINVEMVQQHSEALSAITESIESRLENLLVQQYAGEASRKALWNLEKEEDTAKDDLKNVANRGIIMMEAIQESVSKIMPDVETMLDKLSEKSI